MNDRSAAHPERRRTVFGRRKAKPLKPAQAESYDSLLPRLRLDLALPAPADLGELFPGALRRFRVEIGFGGGEHLVREASRFADTGFFGAEPFVNGVAKLVAAVDRDGIENIRVHDDAAETLLDWLPPRSLARIDLLYPDPWPKRRHWKRRFVNPANLDRIARVLEPDGEFRFASDIDHYVNWTLRHCLAHPGLEWTAKSAADWREPWEGWLRTRYEEKAVREGRRPAYLIFRSRG
ncbi:MAG: tRNA (guanine(46)-N(7))-methyltransferase TrmB [Pseudomonadota bacterium]|nr:tRNA (guanine(46)-N(7))-methyltransferase TrmB [Pseudomonadota bacterium]